ncbi:MAG: DivIVA domain-containing protein [Actinobacteria bacterium]|nr:DivIVA domain-containing protein [Actinomycetota bacterium]MBM3712297.1 DivIVA domain-containing protein [Actinomycetota bacterium]
MEKNAEFIRKKEFHIVFKGYKPEEVDKFLDFLSVEFDRLARKNRELQESLDKLKFESTEEETDIKKVIQDALVSAHKVAEEIKNQAKKEAEGFVEQRKQFEEKALGELQAKKMKLEESMLVLRGKYDELKDKIKKLLENFNQYISEIDADYFEVTEYSEDEALKDLKEEEKIPVETAPEETVAESDEKEAFELKDYKISKESDSGFYFIKEQVKEKKEEQEKSETPETPQELQETEKADEILQKRQRKKIDIANPDIIENFFKASDD